MKGPVIVDAGPLIAMHDIGDAAHDAMRDRFKGLTGEVVTTWPALTEALHIVRRRISESAFTELVTTISLGYIRVQEQPKIWPRVASLLLKYSDLPMDLADATLVVLHEQTPGSRVLTLDADFKLYRTQLGRPIALA